MWAWSPLSLILISTLTLIGIAGLCGHALPAAEVSNIGLVSAAVDVVNGHE
jgi:hypothetical protein